MEIFCGLALITGVLASQFLSVSTASHDAGEVGQHLLDPNWRAEVSQAITIDDPFCLFIGAPGDGPLQFLKSQQSDESVRQAAEWIVNAAQDRLRGASSFWMRLGSRSVRVKMDLLHVLKVLARMP